MSRLLGTLGRKNFALVGVVATLGAAALVLYYQWRAQVDLDAQTRVIFRQISEQTATDVAQEVRRTLDGPVLDTLLAVTHPELMAGRLDLVAEAYEAGLAAYPQVQRFFIWSKETEEVAPGEAMFYRPAGDATPAALTVEGAGFVRDPGLGRTIIDVARRNRLTQHIYAAEELPDRLQLFLRVYWTDAQRLDFYAVLGFLVSPAQLPHMFSVLHERSLSQLLRRRGDDVPLELRVTDGEGRVVYGNPAGLPEASSVTVPMLFYPAARVESRVVTSGISTDLWRVEVDAPLKPRGLLHGYWPTVFSVVLMLGAFALVRGVCHELGLALGHLGRPPVGAYRANCRRRCRSSAPPPKPSRWPTSVHDQRAAHRDAGVGAVLPQLVMNFPSFENFINRLLPLASWPSATKMSPFLPTATPLGDRKCRSSLPPTPASPNVIRSVPSGLNLKT